LVLGCWGPNQTDLLDLSEITFRNPFLLETQDARMRVIDLESAGWPAWPEFAQESLGTLVDSTGKTIDQLMTCPQDGRQPRIYHVRPQPVTNDAPLAIVLHEGAFDYALRLDDQSAYFAQLLDEPGGIVIESERSSRLSRSWADLQVRITLGAWANDPTAPQGALVAALVEQGYQVLAPTNCWGDLWSGMGQNLQHPDEANSFARMGLYLLTATIEVARNAADYELPINFSPDRTVFYMPGDAGRNLSTLASRAAATGGWDLPLDHAPILLESVPDRLHPLLSEDDAFTTLWLDGVGRIHGIERSDLDAAADDLALSTHIESGTYAGWVRLAWFDRVANGTPEENFPYPPQMSSVLAETINTVLGPPSEAGQITDARHPVTNMERTLEGAFWAADAMVDWASQRIDWVPPAPNP
jgi:hypothetical protein